MRKALTKKQDRIFEFIRKHLQDVGYPPTVREIGTAFNISEKGAHDHLNAIEKKGYIRRIPKKPRAIEIWSLCHKNYRKQRSKFQSLDGLPLVSPCSPLRTSKALYPCRKRLSRKIPVSHCGSTGKV